MLWALPLFLLGCGDKSAVSLSANVGSGVVHVENGTFGGSASGSFKLRLSLGPEASGPVKVTPQSFQLLTQAKAVVADQLPITTDTSIPITIGKGENQDVDFAFTGATVDLAVACPGPLTITGSLEDSTSSASYLVTSPLITPTCD